MTDTRKGDLIVRLQEALDTKQMLSDELAAEYCHSRAPAWSAAARSAPPWATLEWHEAQRQAEVDSYLKGLEPALQEFVDSLVIGSTSEMGRTLLDLRVFEGGWLVNERSGGSTWCYVRYRARLAYDTWVLQMFRPDVENFAVVHDIQLGLKRLWDHVRANQVLPLIPAEIWWLTELTEEVCHQRIRVAEEVCHDC